MINNSLSASDDRGYSQRRGTQPIMETQKAVASGRRVEVKCSGSGDRSWLEFLLQYLWLCGVRQGIGPPAAYFPHLS